MTFKGLRGAVIAVLLLLATAAAMARPVGEEAEAPDTVEGVKRSMVPSRQAGQAGQPCRATCKPPQHMASYCLACRHSPPKIRGLD